MIADMAWLHSFHFNFVC